MPFPYGIKPNIDLLMQEHPEYRDVGIAGEVMVQILFGGDEPTAFRTAHQALTAYEHEIAAFVDNKVTDGWKGPGKLPSYEYFFGITMDKNSIDNNPVKVTFSDGSQICVRESKAWNPEITALPTAQRKITRTFEVPPPRNQ